MDHITECPNCRSQLKISLSFASGPRKSAQEPVSTNSLQDLLDSIDMQSLDEMSLEFVKQTKERFEQYRDRTKISEKQMAWLRKLATGMRGAF